MSTQSIKRQLSISIPIALLVVAAGILILRAGARQSDQASPPSAASNAQKISAAGQQDMQIKTVPVQLVALQNKLQASGIVSYPIDQTVSISPRLQGQVRQVLVSVGDHVAAGQTLAVLDSVDAATAQDTALQADNKLALARSTLERAQAQYSMGTPEVTTAQAALDQAKQQSGAARYALKRTTEQGGIGGFGQQPLADAQNAVAADTASLAQSQADLTLAERSDTRIAQLVAIGVNAQQDREAADDTLAKARATVAANQEALVLAQQTLTREQKAYASNLYTDQQVAQVRSAYQQALLQQVAAQRALDIAKIGIRTDLQQAQSDYASAQFDARNAAAALTLLGNPDGDGLMRVKSPVAGVVTARSVNPGQVVDQSQQTPWQMFTVSITRTVWVQAGIYEEDAGAVKLGQPVQIATDALPGRTFAGVVSSISPTLDPKTRTISVRAVIPNPQGLLKDGMYADMTVFTGHAQAAPVVPVEAIQHGADSDYVFVQNGDEYRRREIEVGIERGGLCSVASGLRPGEMVVTQGAIFLGGENNSDSD